MGKMKNKKQLTEKQKVKKWNKEHEEYQLKLQGFTGYIYPTKKHYG